MKDKNDIENSFRNRFDSAEIKEESWNTPSNDVWNKIEKEIFKKEKEKFGFLPFLLAIGLLMTCVFTVYLYFQNQELKQRIENVVVAQEEISDHNEVNVQSGLSKNVNLNSFDSNNKVENYDSPIQNNARAGNSKLGPDSKIFIPASNVKAVSKEDKKGIEEVSKPGNQPRIKVKILNNNTRGLDKVDPIPTLKFLLNTADIQREILKPIILDDGNKTKDKRITFSLLPGVVLGFLTNNGVQETGLSELIDKEYGNAGYGIDFIFSKPISNTMDFSFGVGFDNVSFSTEYDVTLPYKMEDEMVNGEKGFIDFEHSLPTSFGNTETALRLIRTRTSSTLDEPEVGLDFNTNHKFVSVSLPLGLVCRIGKGKSFATAGVEVRPTYILTGKSSIKSVYSHHSDIDAIDNKSVSSYSAVRKFNVGFGVNVGYQWSLSEKSGFNLNAGLQNHLFNFYTVDNFSSAVQKISLRAGYYYNL